MPIYRYSSVLNSNKPEVRVTNNRSGDLKRLVRACKNVGWSAARHEVGFSEDITPPSMTENIFNYWLSITSSELAVVEMLPRHNDSAAIAITSPEDAEPSPTSPYPFSGPIIADRTFPINASSAPFVLGSPERAGQNAPRLVLYELVFHSFEQLG